MLICHMLTSQMKTIHNLFFFFLLHPISIYRVHLFSRDTNFKSNISQRLVFRTLVHNYEV
jgi:hypothetical protein